MHLKSLRQRDPSQLASGASFVGDNIVHPTAKIGQDCKIGPNVSIGIGCEIANGVRISDSVLLHRVKVRSGLGMLMWQSRPVCTGCCSPAHEPGCSDAWCALHSMHYGAWAPIWSRYSPCYLLSFIPQVQLSDSMPHPAQIHGVQPSSALQCMGMQGRC